MNGSLALVGSGEYLPAMAEFEKSLVADGIKNNMQPKFIQIPTAAYPKYFYLSIIVKMPITWSM
jgi:hypothetical protein